MEINKRELGTRIRNVRNKRLESMEKFGQAIANATNNQSKSGKSNVSRWERGENIPNDLTLAAIANLGDISVEELLYGTTLERIKSLANDIYMTNIKENYANEYKVFYNPRVLHQLCLDVHADLYSNGESFNEHNTKEYINQKMKEYIKRDRFEPHNNSNALQFSSHYLRELLNDIYQYFSLSKKDLELISDESKGFTDTLPEIYNNRKLNPNLSHELLAKIQDIIFKSIKELDSLDPGSYEVFYDRIKNKSKDI